MIGIREARNAGLGWTRIHASVMTPRIPSEPITRRSGLGPAPEPGKDAVIGPITAAAEAAGVQVAENPTRAGELMVEVVRKLA